MARKHDKTTAVKVPTVPQVPKLVYVQSAYNLRDVMQSNVCLYEDSFYSQVLLNKKSSEALLIKENVAPLVKQLVTRPPKEGFNQKPAVLEGFDLVDVRVFILVPPEHADWGNIYMIAINNGTDVDIGGGVIEHKPYNDFTEKLIAFLDMAIQERKDKSVPYTSGGLWRSNINVSIVEWRLPSESKQYKVSNQIYSVSPSLLADVKQQSEQLFGQEIATLSDVRYKKFLEMK